MKIWGIKVLLLNDGDFYGSVTYYKEEDKKRQRLKGALGITPKYHIISYDLKDFAKKMALEYTAYNDAEDNWDDVSENQYAIMESFEDYFKDEKNILKEIEEMKTIRESLPWSTGGLLSSASDC